MATTKPRDAWLQRFSLLTKTGSLTCYVLGKGKKEASLETRFIQCIATKLQEEKALRNC